MTGDPRPTFARRRGTPLVAGALALGIAGCAGKHVRLVRPDPDLVIDTVKVDLTDTYRFKLTGQCHDCSADEMVYLKVTPLPPARCPEYRDRLPVIGGAFNLDGALVECELPLRDGNVLIVEAVVARPTEVVIADGGPERYRGGWPRPENSRGETRLEVPVRIAR
jgi:hypothetical protein